MTSVPALRPMPNWRSPPAVRSSSAIIVKQKTVELAQGLIKAALPESVQVSEMRAGAEFDWLNDILSLQFWQHSPQTHRTAPTQFSLPEVRFFMEGDVVVAGMRFDHIGQEDSSMDKRCSSLESDFDFATFIKMAQAHGFLFRGEPGTAVVLPPGYAICEVCVGDEESHGLHWSFFGSAALAKLSADALAWHMRTSPTISTTVRNLKNELDDYMDRAAQSQS